VAYLNGFNMRTYVVLSKRIPAPSVDCLHAANVGEYLLVPSDNSFAFDLPSLDASKL